MLSTPGTGIVSRVSMNFLAFCLSSLNFDLNGFLKAFVSFSAVVRAWALLLMVVADALQVYEWMLL